MKKLLILFSAAMLLLSAGVCSAKKPAPLEKKAKQFVERLFYGFENQDEGALEKTFEDLGDYMSSIDETQTEEFIGAFAKYFYEYSDMYDYGKAFADIFLMELAQALAESDQE